MRLVFSGSFDPITSGHMDIIKRASAICDELIVCVFVNNKKQFSYSLEKRKEMIEKAIEGLENVRAEFFEGLQADFCKKVKADAILRGIRNEKDFAYEKEMALVNRCKLGVDTMIMISDPSVSFVSSSIVRELLEFGSDVKGLVPDNIIDIL